MATYLLVISDREALGWIVSEQRMAFSSPSRPYVRSVAPGDTLLLYTTRGCFKNPTRDRGRIIGQATVEGSMRTLEEPVRFAGRTFPVGCRISVHGLVPLGQGIELVPLLGRLSGIRSNGTGWTYQLRQPLVPLTDHDRAVVEQELAAVEAVPLERSGYLRWWPSPASSR